MLLLIVDVAIAQIVVGTVADSVIVVVVAVTHVRRQHVFYVLQLIVPKAVVADIEYG